jgi:hypothetical protein
MSTDVSEVCAASIIRVMIPEDSELHAYFKLLNRFLFLLFYIVHCIFLVAYLLLQIVLTKANSTNEPMMNVVQTMNHTSFVMMYETLGMVLPVWDESMMNVNILLMPGK